MPSLKMLLCLSSVALIAPAPAQEPPGPPLPAIRETSPGVYEIGKVHLEQKTRTARLPGLLNMREGICEYLLVTEQGAAHESLLVTDATPNDLHFAMLLLGAKGSGLAAPAPTDAPPPQINAEYLKAAPQLQGDPLRISVQWEAGGETKTTPVEDWLFNTALKKPMARGPWIYNGSMFNDGHFLAQIEGAFAALVTYPSALINNPRKGRDNDQIWTVNEKAVPALKTPLHIIFQLLEKPAPEPAP